MSAEEVDLSLEHPTTLFQFWLIFSRTQYLFMNKYVTRPNFAIFVRNIIYKPLPTKNPKHDCKET